MGYREGDICMHSHTIHVMYMQPQAAEQQSAFLNEALSLKDLVLLGEIIDKLTPATEHQVS